jgi:ferredoxin, 2Fe-2S
MNMSIKVTIIEHDGIQRTVEAHPGASIMEIAVNNGVPGIDAECGGACACATCHIYVDAAWLKKLPAPSDSEEAMLGFAAHRQTNSRLSCQIRLDQEHDGIVVTTPEFQF